MDKFDIEILEDGTISIKTDAISKKNHHSADCFMEEVFLIASGKIETKQRHNHSHSHNHTQNHTHSHN